MNTVSEQSFEKALDRIRELSRSNAELLDALQNLSRWVGKGIADDLYSECVNPGRAIVDLERATEAIRKAGR